MDTSSSTFLFADSRHDSLRKDERGVGMVLFSLLIVVVVSIAALVIDHSKQEISAQNVQRAADSAALGAARRLNGRIDGWWDSKKAAVAALRNNPIHGASDGELQSISLSDGAHAFWDDSNNLTGRMTRGLQALPESHTAPSGNSGSEGTVGKIKVTVERGLYWSDGEKYTFKSLEADTDGLSSAVPYYLIANAVKVTVSLESLDTIFGGVMGMFQTAAVRREAIAVMDTTLERNVLPVGIPICQLLFDTDPYQNAGDHLSERYKPVRQCERSMYVTELDAKGDVSEDMGVFSGSGTDGTGMFTPSSSSSFMSLSERRDGLVRAESFERPAYYWKKYDGTPNLCYLDYKGHAHNCKALPMYGTLGLPSNGPHEEADAIDVRRAINRNGIVAKVGQYFKPLASLSGLSDDGARQEIAEGIKSSPHTFRDVFLTGNPKNPDPRVNFPFLRTRRVPIGIDPQNRPALSGAEDVQDKVLYDQNIAMPAAHDWIKFIMMDRSKSGGKSQLNFSNPMCHDENLRHDDPDNARVLQLYAMVIAPNKEFVGTDLVRYCDFERVFQSTIQRAIAPIPETEPVVVGFVKINVFDFNFQRLDTRPQANPDDPNPLYPATQGKGNLWDGNPAALNLFGNQLSKDFITKTNQYSEEYDKCDDKSDSNGSENSNGKSDKDNCRDDLPPMPEPPDVASLEQCFDLDEYHALEVALKKTAPLGERYGFLKKLKDILELPIPARPNVHCLPRLRDGYFNRNSLDSYTPLHDLKPGVGCGGLRARLDDCESEDISLPTGQDINQNSPALVTVSD
ncbi:MAG: pilus assembly protein TadG-related protein [Bdellovibrionota bacterium]